LDLLHGLGTARRVAAVYRDIGTIPRELKGDRTAEAGRGSRDKRL
jgi:hypothetical protein